MLSSLKSYCLQEIGIVRWEMREVSSPSWYDMINPDSGSADFCFLLEKNLWDAENRWPAGKEGQLLRNIVRALGVPQSRVAMIFAKPCGRTMAEYRDNQLTLLLKDLQPNILFLMGQFELGIALTETTVIQSTALNTLLTEPFKKKQAYQQLLLVGLAKCSRPKS
jgi:hypothetical protein